MYLKAYHGVARVLNLARMQIDLRSHISPAVIFQLYSHIFPKGIELKL